MVFKGFSCRLQRLGAGSPGCGIRPLFGLCAKEDLAGAKAHVSFVALPARLKSSPDT